MLYFEHTGETPNIWI